jgi:glycosyltransferase involved in cell wall biosynthesis
VAAGVRALGETSGAGVTIGYVEEGARRARVRHPRRAVGSVADSQRRRLGPDRIQVVLLSFEGPDRYSAAGGLAIRVNGLAESLVQTGYAVHLFFVGDPDRPGVETAAGGVVLHRWCQAISRHASGGVYSDEERKIEDLCVWLPDHLAGLVAAGRDAGMVTVVLAEEWHMAWPLIALDTLLRARGLRHHALLAWNANNRFGFERLNFARLAEAASLLTVSKAMKHVMWGWGVNPLVVPNGLLDRWLAPPPEEAGRALRSRFREDMLLAKVGRWHPDKRWRMALDVVAALRRSGRSGVLIARGWAGDPAADAHYRELRGHAAGLGLDWAVCHHPGPADDELVRPVWPADTATPAVVELAFPTPEPQLRVLYRGADAVIANSGFEPFGLVGLEAMAAGAVVVTGSFGEDYMSVRNGFSLDTDLASEVLQCLDWLQGNPDREAAMRTSAVDTASHYRWTLVLDRLLRALELDADRQLQPST